MNIRKDERCFFERCSLRKKFCDLPCSAILPCMCLDNTCVSLDNTNYDVELESVSNLRKRLRI